MQELHKIIKKWSPCIWIGWNSIGFDFIMIQKENYKSLFPPYTLNTNSNEQADFLPVARSSKIFFPNSINTKLSEKKNPIFQLETLSTINDIKVKQFHTAISDCEACLGIMKIIKNKANPIYQDSFNTISKHKVLNILEKERLFTTTFYYYAKARPFLVTYLCDHGEYKWPMVFCLEQDPENFFKLDVSSLKEELAKIEQKANEINAEKQQLEKQIALAEERGDSAMVARLTDRVTILDEEFDAADDAYQEQAKKLRETASATSGALAEQTNSFFDKMVTEGGFFGSIIGGLSKATSFVFGTDELGMEGEAKTKYLSEQIRKIDGQIAEQQALIESGDDWDWKMTNRKTLIAGLEREKARLEKVNTAARGGIIVNRPTYLPSSGTVVGEHGTFTGSGAARGGISDGGPEAVIPLGGVRGQQIMSPLAQSIAGSVINHLAMDRVGLQTGGEGGSQNVIDSSSTQIVNNNTIINSPEPQGPMLPGVGRDTAVSHFRHAA